VAPRVVVVVKRTAYRHYVEEGHDERVVTLLSQGDPVVEKMAASHAEHERAAHAVGQALEELGAEVTWVQRAHTPFDGSQYDLVVTVGGDGTLLGASHNVAGVPVLGVNSDPQRSVGFFCGVSASPSLKADLSRALAGQMPGLELSRMEVLLNGKPIARRVLNDALFCHRSPAATSRYIVELHGLAEEHKSSGFWIGPAPGSTAAQRSAGGRILPLTSRKLQFIVREPYTPAGERLTITRALVGEGEELVVRSKMRDAEVFFDGPHDSFRIELGDTLVFHRAPESLQVLGISSRRRWRNADAEREDS
jgi:NAD+ kinase